MPHLNLPDALPGIRGLMAFRPETAKPLNELVEMLLWSHNSLHPGERELIATYVSAQNDCCYPEGVVTVEFSKGTISETAILALIAQQGFTVEGHQSR